MKRLLATLLLLFSLSSLAFSGEKYYITETQLQGFERTISYQNEMLENANNELKSLSKKYETSERTNELQSKVILGETVVILTLIPIMTVTFIKLSH